MPVPFTRPASMMVWFQDMDKTVQTDYFIFVVRGGGETVVVDCGVRPDLAAERRLAGYVNPVEVLKRIGVDAGKVKHLVVTHIHFDHVSGIRLFPKANIYVQEKEFRFWIKDPIAKRAPFLHVSDLGANQYLKKLEGIKEAPSGRGGQENPSGDRTGARPRTYPRNAGGGREYRQGKGDCGLGCRPFLYQLPKRYPQRHYHRPEGLDENL